MDLQEFKEYVEKFDENFVEKIRDFKIVCKKCGSEKVHLLWNGERTAEGSEYTGTYTTEQEVLILKCESCGSANIMLGNLDELLGWKRAEIQDRETSGGF